MFKHILLPVDGSEHAEKAAAVAGDLASKYGADVLVLHVVDTSHLAESTARMAEIEHVAESGPRMYPWVANVPAEMAAMLQPQVTTGQRQRAIEFVAERIVGASVDRLHEHGVDDDHIRVVLKDGNPVKRILETAAQEHSDLVVMGSRGLSDLAGALTGSVSHRVIHRAECTVISVK